jgi:hypothetical protein
MSFFSLFKVNGLRRVKGRRRVKHKFAFFNYDEIICELGKRETLKNTMTKENFSILLNGIKFFKNLIPLAVFMDLFSIDYFP